MLVTIFKPATCRCAESQKSLSSARCSPVTSVCCQPVRRFDLRRSFCCFQQPSFEGCTSEWEAIKVRALFVLKHLEFGTSVQFRHPMFQPSLRGRAKKRGTIGTQRSSNSQFFNYHSSQVVSSGSPWVLIMTAKGASQRQTCCHLHVQFSWSK